MIKSCTKVLYRIESEKFDDSMKEVFERRKLERMQKLEELKNRNANLPRSSSAVVFKDRCEKMKLLQKNSIYNVKNLFTRAPKKVNRNKRKMSRNQYFKLQSYMKKKKGEMNSKNTKDRYDTSERPEFNYFKKEDNRDAWEDYSYNPKTTLMLRKRIKTSMKSQSERNKKEQKRLLKLGDQLRKHFIT